jgi:hypothetical protein
MVWYYACNVQYMRLLAIILLLLGSCYAQGQGAPVLDFYASTDGNFRFVYPDNFDLLVGDGILKRTQGRHVGVPVCDTRTALACVIYPAERFQGTNFEAAAFSVNRLASISTAGDCMEYSDRTTTPNAERISVTSVSIGGYPYRYASTATTVTGHSQSVQRFRVFQNESCYELRVAVSLSDTPPNSENKFKSTDADAVNNSLKRILSTFAFTR